MMTLLQNAVSTEMLKQAVEKIVTVLDDTTKVQQYDVDEVILNQEDICKLETTKSPTVMFGPGEFEISSDICISPYVKTLRGIKDKTTLVLKAKITGSGQALENLSVIIVPQQGQDFALENFGMPSHKVKDLDVYIAEKAENQFAVFKGCMALVGINVFSALKETAFEVHSNTAIFVNCRSINCVLVNGLFKTVALNSSRINDLEVRAYVQVEKQDIFYVLKGSNATNVGIDMEIKGNKGFAVLAQDSTSNVTNIDSRIKIEYV